MFEPAVTGVFGNVNLPLFVHFSSSSKIKYFVLSFEVNFTIFTPIWSKQEQAIIAFKMSVEKDFLMKIFPLCDDSEKFISVSKQYIQAKMKSIRV